MSSNSAINVTNLDFDTIKSGLKSYISSKPEFTDYNFEGSTVNLLLDVLAYNTYQNAFYASMVGNEMFLDSAQLRNNVVSRAKTLGYTTRSARGSSIVLDVTITPTDSPVTITIAKNTEFQAEIDGVTYTWVTPEAYYITVDENGAYQSNTITIIEGTLLTHKWTVDTNNPTRYIIPNQNVDTNSLEVNVRESAGSSTLDNYIVANDIIDVNSTSKVYFLQEVDDGKYEVIFGDGVLGKALLNNNVVEINYRVCNGTKTNGVSSFTEPSTLGGYSDFTISYIDSTTGGAEIESIESIKFNAPKFFESQNRAVLANDYKRLITQNFSYASSVNVWGGEDNDPPVYGKVFVSVKPSNGSKLGLARKNDIFNFLNKYNVMSVNIEFVDPTYIYIKPTIIVNYDSSLTSLSASEVRTKVATAITEFESSNLGSFENKIFRYSRFIDKIDDADISIKSNNTTLIVEKRFYPSFTTSTKYTIDFGNALRKRSSDNKPVISSTSFTMSGKTAFLEDDGEGVIKSYYFSGSVKIYINENQGTINYNTGIMLLDAFNPTASVNDEIAIRAIPLKNDIRSNRYQILLLADTLVTMYDENTETETVAITVSTTGSVTQVVETGIGTVV